MAMTGNPSASAPPRRPFVSIVKASLTYDADASGKAALADVDLDVAEGEFAAIVGPSGCGKSTLLKLVSGLRPPSSGTVTVAGEPVNGPLKIVGMAFQNPILLPWRTTLDNLLLPLEVVEPHRRTFRRDRPRHCRRATELLASVGLHNVGDHHPWQLSGGMQQRVSLCRALIHGPAMLLLDEPFGALDAFTREELWETLQQLWLARRVTVLLVTHDLVEAAFLADVVHVVSNRPGRIVYSRRIDLPRPRRLDDRYTPHYTDLIRDLRHHIGRARSGA